MHAINALFYHTFFFSKYSFLKICLFLLPNVLLMIHICFLAPFDAMFAHTPINTRWMALFRLTSILLSNLFLAGSLLWLSDPKALQFVWLFVYFELCLFLLLATYQGYRIDSRISFLSGILVFMNNVKASADPQPSFFEHSLMLWHKNWNFSLFYWYTFGLVQAFGAWSYIFSPNIHLNQKHILEFFQQPFSLPYLATLLGMIFSAAISLYNTIELLNEHQKPDPCPTNAPPLFILWCYLGWQRYFVLCALFIVFMIMNRPIPINFTIFLFVMIKCLDELFLYYQFQNMSKRSTKNNKNRVQRK